MIPLRVIDAQVRVRALSFETNSMRALIYKADFRRLEIFYRRLVTDEEVVPRELYRGINYVSLRAFIAFKIIYSYLIFLILNWHWKICG